LKGVQIRGGADLKLTALQWVVDEEINESTTEGIEGFEGYSQSK